jgi:perosamine synthetase
MNPAAARGNRPRIAMAIPDLSGNESRYVAECLRTGWVSSLGAFIEPFEASFAAFCDVRYVVACNNGTSALHLALRALDLSPGDEVIVPSLTFIATANAVAYCGATPVFVDSAWATMNIDPDQIEARITERTRGIIAVHLYGRPADMDALMAIASRHGLWVVEDAAQAHGAMYRGRRVGGIGHAATFSFFGNKIVTTGEGGAVTTNDPEIASRVRLLRAHGMSPERKYWFPVVGFNYRMTNIQAAIGLAQMERIDHLLERRCQVARWYTSELWSHEDLVEVPQAPTDSVQAHWAYAILLRQGSERARDAVIAALAGDGIETRPGFHPLHLMPPYAHARAMPLSNAERLAAAGLVLPMHTGLTKEDVAFIVARVLEHGERQLAGERPVVKTMRTSSESGSMRRHAS